MDPNRTITDADAQAIADALREQLAKEFKLEVGNSVIVWAKKALIGALIIFAAYHYVGLDIPVQATGRHS